MRASALVIDPIESEALMVTMDDLSDARVDTGVPTKADAHAVAKTTKSKPSPGGTVADGGGGVEQGGLSNKKIQARSVQT